MDDDCIVATTDKHSGLSHNFLPFPDLMTRSPRQSPCLVCPNLSGAKEECSGQCRHLTLYQRGEDWGLLGPPTTEPQEQRLWVRKHHYLDENH